MKKEMINGQVTIFIIMAIVIAAAVLLVVFYPRIKMIVQPATPAGYVEDCVKKELIPAVEKLSASGGSFNPENTILYQGREIEYLCYTNEYYKTCSMQIPFIKQNFESELTGYIAPIAEQCVNQMASDFKDKGYNVNVKKGDISVEIVPHSVKVAVNHEITVEKESVQNLGKIIVAENSEMYDMLMISQNILDWEARYGDSAPETFMMYYPDIKVEKLKQGDGSKIYIVTNKESKEEFTFATRSLSWPAGYGTEKFVK